jgi:hypothetical protein
MAVHGVDGVYLDGTSEPWICMIRRNACDYGKPDGSVEATYPIFATLQLMKRNPADPVDAKKCRRGRKVPRREAGRQHMRDSGASAKGGGLARSGWQKPPCERRHEHTAGDRVQPKTRVIMTRHYNPETPERHRGGGVWKNR